MGHDNDQERGNGQWDAHGAFDPSSHADPPQPPAFDGYDLLDVPLGDLLRGERATLGKSLLDVERELRIRATYIAAIENGDVGAFQSPGFIAGYVRSYARYLSIDPEWTFRRFCDETGFRGIHGGAAGQAGDVKRHVSEAPRRLDPNEVMSSTRISYAPANDSFLARVEPGALGSVAVLVLLACGIGYGAWAILHDIQRLNIAPIDEAPAVPLAQLDPLAGAAEGAFDAEQGFDIAVPGPDSADRLYRPQALEAPVLTPRDSAIGTVDPNEVGALADATTRSAPQLGADPQAPTVQVTQAVDQVMIFATNPTWVQITAPSGDTIYEATLNRGDSFVIPEGDGVPRLRSGNAGSLYFAVNGVARGPAGVGASIARDVELAAEILVDAYPEVETGETEVIEIASAVLEANALPDAPVIVPTQQPSVVYDPTGGTAGQVETALTLFPEISPERAAAIIASNALPVVVRTPDASTERPLPRP